MIVSNLRRNNVNTVSGNNGIKPLKYIYTSSVLVAGLYQTYRNDITELVNIASVDLDLRHAITY